MSQKITYEDKHNLHPVTDRPTQATAEDFNEIKDVVNSLSGNIDMTKSDEVPLVAGTNTVAFRIPYPLGAEFVVIVHNCYDSRGYTVGHSIDNKTLNGFDVTVPVDCNLLYLSVERR